MTTATMAAFKHYFWTAQLTAGLSMAVTGLMKGGGLLGALLGFTFVLPLAAAGAGIKVWADRRWPPKVGPQPTRWWGAILVGLAICSPFIAVMLYRTLAG
jgi:hypothetical protein